jgi:heat shock protein HslJ
MKKIIIVVSILVVLGLIAGGAYYFLIPDDGYGDPRPPKDLTGIIVPPVEFPMKGNTFVVPGASSTQSVVLDLVSPTATRDYPMARYTDSSGAVSTLVALDDFTTSYTNNVRAVPIVVSGSDSVQMSYLAILEGGEGVHVTSLPIGEMIKIESVTRTDNSVAVAYLVHDRLQEVTEVPKVPTTAIFDIATKQIVQVGRIPKDEEYVEVKSFAGQYLWQDTTASDGTKITPIKPDTFTLLFDANRISLGTDCNTGSANFVSASGSSTKFTVEEIVQTKMFCESAQESEYFSMVTQITNYSEGGDGALAFDLSDGGVMVFVPKVKKLEFAATSTDVQ